MTMTESGPREHRRFRSNSSRLRFGDTPDFPVGYTWYSRVQMCRDGVHGTTRRGIQGMKDGARSIALSGRYEDDRDMGHVIIYTGEGGQGHSSTKDQSQTEDQHWTPANKALRTSFENQGPIRVYRSYSLNSIYAPVKGYRYDGLYIVTSYDVKPGKSGHNTIQFQLERCPGQPPLPLLGTTFRQSSPSTHSSSSSNHVPNPRKPIYIPVSDDSEIEWLEESPSPAVHRGRNKNLHPAARPKETDDYSDPETVEWSTKSDPGSDTGRESSKGPKMDDSEPEFVGRSYSSRRPVKTNRFDDSDIEYLGSRTQPIVVSDSDDEDEDILRNDQFSSLGSFKPEPDRQSFNQDFEDEKSNSVYDSDEDELMVDD